MSLSNRPSLNHALCRIGGVLLMVCSVSAQTDDFNDNNDAGWSRVDSLGIGSFAVSGGEYRLTSPASPDPGTFGAARVASHRTDVVYTDFCVSVDIVASDESLSQAVGLTARIQPGPGLGATSGYIFTYQPRNDDIVINRITNEAPVPISSEADLPYHPTAVRLVLIGRGDYLEARIYDTADLATPLATVSTFDSDYASGTCGVVVADFSGGGDGTVDATFDNYRADAAVLPPLAIKTLPSSALQLEWPDQSGCWVLETSTTLEGDSWSEIFTGITHEPGQGQFVYLPTPEVDQVQRFWRLVVPDGT